ncbi:MAG TPA: cytochrome c [Polyangia bacterium]|nr:cytochrome c [Polyangia bacterium]
MRIILNFKRLAPLGALVTALAVGAGAGCATRALPEPSTADAVRAANLWPGTTVDDLHRGKQRYVQSCSGCHGLIDPHQFPEARWPGFVKEMSGRLQLSSNDLQDLTRYLVVASQAPRTN